MGNAAPGSIVATAMTTWGFIGSGNIGTTVATLAVAAGHEVIMSNSRGPATLESLVAQLGPRSRAARAQQAAAEADLVVVTIPLGRYQSVPVAELAGKVVVDTMNYYPQRDGRIAALDDESTTTSELLAAHLPQSDVVKAFNNIFFGHLAVLARPSGAPDRTTLPIAGDNAGAKEWVTELLDQIGYDALDIGLLAQGWRTQVGEPAYGMPYAADPENWPAGSRPAGRLVIEQAVGRARRYRDM